MPQFLPLRANVDWLRKSAKDWLVSMRAANPAAKLHDAQLALARKYGFASWRKMVTHVEEVRSQLKALIPQELADSGGIAPDDPQLAKLFTAIDAGDTSTANELIKSCPALVKAHGTDGQTPLHLAAQRNDPQLGLTLLAYGADPNARYGENGHTALSWAITCNATEFAKTSFAWALPRTCFSRRAWATWSGSGSSLRTPAKSSKERL